MSTYMDELRICLIVVLLGLVFGKESRDERVVFNLDPVVALYEKYKEALTETSPLPSRRLHRSDGVYEIHVQKLKEVNGYKRHNLNIHKTLRDGTKEIVYINNPLEAKFPHPYVELDEFKEALNKNAKKIKQVQLDPRKVTKVGQIVLEAIENSADINSHEENLSNASASSENLSVENKSTVEHKLKDSKVDQSYVNHKISGTAKQNIDLVKTAKSILDNTQEKVSKSQDTNIEKNTEKLIESLRQEAEGELDNNDDTTTLLDAESTINQPKNTNVVADEEIKEYNTATDIMDDIITTLKTVEVTEVNIEENKSVNATPIVTTEFIQNSTEEVNTEAIEKNEETDDEDTQIMTEKADDKLEAEGLKPEPENYQSEETETPTTEAPTTTARTWGTYARPIVFNG